MTSTVWQERLASLESRRSGQAFRGPVLSVEELSVNFAGIHALRDVSLDLSADEVLAVVGPNGAGKSTLLNAVSGLIREHCSGAINLQGRKILGLHPAAVARAGVGRTFQDPPLIDDETVLENVMLGAHLHLGYRMMEQIFLPGRVRKKEAGVAELAMAVIEFVGLGDQAGSRVGGLSYGSRKLIDIARALLSEPRILLMDEPTSGLDSRERAIVQDLLLELRRTPGLAVIVVEHHMDVVRLVADRVVGLQAGGVLAVGSPEQVLDSIEFRAALVGTLGEGAQSDS
ncbi:MAG TPA: ATP-binding cassette domain-containing protein [Jatrophihabitantaceae bacterium]|jgi:branched-chain amino acid transport system ATP-binding protein|nr:ATP-binding cassette domain-containing protein [Jatrophihabitantaceae bacterium]